jgi:hypothetical protein
MNKYWMEDTYGKYGVQLDAFGPYRMPKKSFEYHVVESITGGTGASCPVQTNAAGAQTNVTNIAVASSALFTVGQPINVGTSARTITAIPDATHITVNTNTSPANNAGWCRAAEEQAGEGGAARRPLPSHERNFLLRSAH